MNDNLNNQTNDNLITNTSIEKNVITSSLQNDYLPVNNQSNNNNPKKSNNIKIVLIVCLVLILLGGAFFVWNKFFDKQNNLNEQKETDSVQTNNEDNNEEEKKEESKYNIVLYRSKDGYCINKDSLCSEGTIQVSVNHADAQFESVVNLDKHYAIYTDNYVYLYDIDDEDSTKLKIEVKDYNVYDFVVNNKTKKIIGIFCGYQEDDDFVRTAFYNVNNDKLLYDGKYYNYEVAGNGYLRATLKTGTGDSDDDYTQFLLNQNKEDVLISKVGKNIKYQIDKSGNDFIIIETNDNNGELYSTVYTKDKKVIFNDKENTLWSIDDGNVFISDDNVVKKYNYSGITLRTSRNLNKVLHMVMNYAVTINDSNDLVLVNIDSNKEYKVLSWNNEYYYFVDKSGYYENSDTKKAGIYLTIGLGNGSMDSDEEIQVYYFDPKTNEISKVEISNDNLD